MSFIPSHIVKNEIDNSRIYLMDCVEAMKCYPDKYFDLAVVDPPYGIGEDGSKNQTRSKLATAKTYKGFAGFDKEPPKVKYFDELFRVSKNQIIWGANHFLSRILVAIPMLKEMDSQCWIVWDKDNGNSDFADCELAYTSFNKAVRKFKFKWQGMLQENMKHKEFRIHPTQKPVALYDWIFKNYAEPGMKILDTHLGSGSSRIAAHKAGLDFTGFELDEDYFQAHIKRFNNYHSQLTLFSPSLTE